MLPSISFAAQDQLSNTCSVASWSNSVMFHLSICFLKFLIRKGSWSMELGQNHQQMYSELIQ